MSKGQHTFRRDGVLLEICAVILLSTQVKWSRSVLMRWIIHLLCWWMIDRSGGRTAGRVNAQTKGPDHSHVPRLRRRRISIFIPDLGCTRFGHFQGPTSSWDTTSIHYPKHDTNQYVSKNLDKTTDHLTYLFFLVIPHDDIFKWKHFPRYWPFVRRIHWGPVNSRTKASDAELWCFLWSAPE